MKFGEKSSFSSCQKNVLLGPKPVSNFLSGSGMFQQLLEECTIGTALSCELICSLYVSVVVRRMYYWDTPSRNRITTRSPVSVVVRRMYYWDANLELQSVKICEFQQLLEECTIGTPDQDGKGLAQRGFSSCQKNVLLGRYEKRDPRPYAGVSVVVRRMYYWDCRNDHT